MPYTLEDARAAVANGVKLLDEKRPGWRDLVDVARFDIEDCTECILGQAFGGYTAGLLALYGTFNPADESEGFDVSDDGIGSDTDYFREVERRTSLLDQAWREELTKER